MDEVDALTKRIKDITKILVDGSASKSINDKKRLEAEREKLKRERRQILDTRSVGR